MTVSPARESSSGALAGAPPERSPAGETDTDILLSAHYACLHCNRSYQEPTPQLFSFNSPQGMCPECDGLGTLHSFDPNLLIPDPTISFVSERGQLRPANPENPARLVAGPVLEVVRS